MTEVIRTRPPAGEQDTATRHRAAVREAVRRHREKKKAAGYKRLSLWVPEHLHEYAKRAVNEVIKKHGE